MTPNGPPDDFADFIADVLAQADIETERSGAAAVYDQIVADFETLGFDVDAEELEFMIIVQSWLSNDDWNSDTAVLLMDAMIDGELTQDELAVLYAVQSVDEVIHEVVEDSAENAGLGEDATLMDLLDAMNSHDEDANEAANKLFDELMEAGTEAEKERLALDTRGDLGWLAPLADILVYVSLKVGDRLEGFIANALDVERR